MSLLLDALKKSDDERRALEIASLRNLPISATTNAPSRLRLLPMVALVVLLGAGYFAYSHWLESNAAREKVALAADQQRLEASRTREAQRRQAREQADQTALREELKQQQLTQPQRPTSNEAMMQAIAASINPNIINNSQTFGATVPTAPPPTQAKMPAANAQPAPPIETSKTEPAKAPDAVAEITAAAADPAVENAAPPPNKLPRAYELPFGARQALPNTTLNMHVYSRDAQQRVVMINMESGREGTMLKTGLVIREITPVGVVVEYQGTEFFIDP